MVFSDFELSLGITNTGLEHGRRKGGQGGPPWILKS